MEDKLDFDVKRLMKRVPSQTEDQWKKLVKFNEEMKEFQYNFGIRFDELRTQTEMFKELQKAKSEAETSVVQQSDRKTAEFELSHQLNNSNRYESLQIPKIDFPIFDGVGPGEWIRKCEQYFTTLVVLDDDLKIRLAELHLRGEADLWMIRWKLDNPFMSRSWKFLKDAVNNRFGEPMEDIVDEFHGLNQSMPSPDYETLEVNGQLYSQQIISCESAIKHSIVEEYEQDKENDDLGGGMLPSVYVQTILGFGCESTMNGSTNSSPKAWFEEDTSGLKMVLGKKVVEDGAHKLLDELNKPMPIYVTRVNKAYAEGKDVALSIDATVMFYFDPGGCHLAQMGCVLFELHGEQGTRWFTTTVIDTFVRSDEYYNDASVSPSSKGVSIFELAVSIQNGVIVKAYDMPIHARMLPNQETQRDFAEWKRKEFFILTIVGTMMMVKISSDPSKQLKEFMQVVFNVSIQKMSLNEKICNVEKGTLWNLLLASLHNIDGNNIMANVLVCIDWNGFFYPSWENSFELATRAFFSVSGHLISIDSGHLISIDVTDTDLQTYVWKPGQYMIPCILEDNDVLKRNGIGVQLALKQDEGLNGAFAYHSGAYVGHTIVGLRDSDRKLHVGESGHENDDLIVAFQWDEWWEFELTKYSSNLYTFLLHLCPGLRAKVNETSAWEYARSMFGRPYGYRNLNFSWIDTICGNYSPPLDAHFIASVVTAWNQMQPAYAANTWKVAFDERLGTQGLGLPETLIKIAKHGFSLDEPLAIPVQYDRVYIDGHSTSCIAFVHEMYKEAGLSGEPTNPTMPREIRWKIIHLLLLHALTLSYEVGQGVLIIQCVGEMDGHSFIVAAENFVWDPGQYILDFSHP